MRKRSIGDADLEDSVHAPRSDGYRLGKLPFAGMTRRRFVENAREETADTGAEDIARAFEPALSTLTEGRRALDTGFFFLDGAEAFTRAEDQVHGKIGDAVGHLGSAAGLTEPDAWLLQQLTEGIPLGIDQPIAIARRAFLGVGFVTGVATGNPALAGACLKGLVHEVVSQVAKEGVKSAIVEVLIGPEQSSGAIEHPAIAHTSLMGHQRPEPTMRTQRLGEVSADRPELRGPWRTNHFRLG